MADSTVSIGADLTELRRELTKIPNLSSEAAQKTLIQLEKVVQKAEKSVKRSAKSMARSQKQASKVATSALKEFGDQAGDTDSLLKGIAGAVGLISPEADRALSKLGDLAGGFEGVTRINTNLNLSLAAVGTALGVVTLAAGALATVALVVANRTAEARAKLAEYKDTLRDTDAETRSLAQSQAALQLATGDVAGFVANLEIQTALLNGQIERADITSGELGGTLADKLRPSLLAAGKAVAENQKRIDDLDASLKSGRLSLEDRITAIREHDEALKAQTGLEENLADIKALQDEGVDAINAYVTALRGKSEEERENTSVVEDLVEENTELLRALQETSDFLVFVAGAERDLRRERELQADLDALAPADLVDPRTVRRVRDLTDQVDALIPPSVLSEVDQLQLLLFQLEGAAMGAGGENEELADAIERVRGRLAATNEEGGDGDENGPGFMAAIVRGAKGAVAALGRVQAAVGNVAGAVTGAIGLFDQLLQGIAGFGLSDLVDVARAGGEERDILNEAGEVIGTEIVGPGQIVEEMVAGAVESIGVLVDSAPEVAAAFGAELGGLLDTALQSLEPLVDAALDLAKQVVDSLIERFDDAADTLAPILLKVVRVVLNQAVKLLDSLFPALEALVSKLVSKLPALLGPVLEKLPALLGQVFSAAGGISRAVSAIVDDLVLMLIAAVPSLIESFTAGATDLGIDVVESLIEELVPKLPRITAEITKLLVVDLPILAARMAFEAVEKIGASVDGMIDRLISRLRGLLADLLEELRPGDQTTATFGDTPGPVRAGLRGLQARFAPGDTVIAAQDPAELARQAQQAGGGSPGFLDIRDGHLAIERSLVRNVRAGGALSRLLGGSSGRVKVYG